MQKSQLLKAKLNTLESYTVLELELNNSLEQLQQMSHASATQKKTTTGVLDNTSAY